MRTLYNIFLVIAMVFSLAVLVYIVVDIIRVHMRASRIKKKKEEAPAAPAPPPAPSKEEVLLTEIRDLLKEQSKK